MSAPHIYSVSPRRPGLSAEEYLLRQAGDWRGYISLMNSDAIDASPFFRSMMNYYEAGMKSFEDMKPESEGLLMATSVWGNSYMARFLTLCIPSVLEKSNLAALKQRNARLFIHTDAAGRDVIACHPAIRKLTENNIQVQIMLLSDEVLDMMKTIPYAKYWHLGMTQSMHLQYARALGASYHLMMPDIVCSAGYFERLFAIGKPFIAHGCVSCDQKLMPFDDYRNGMELVIPPSRLMTLALLHTHPRAEHHFVRNGKRLPRSHLLIFEGKDEAGIMSPHQSIAYMSAAVVAAVRDRIFFTLDSELDKITDVGTIYTPCAADALVMSEVSAEDTQIYERKETNDIAEYCAVFRQRIPEKPLHELFLRGMSFPVERHMMEKRRYMQENEIREMKEELRANLCPAVLR